MTNILIYRGKKIDSDEYVIGYYSDTYHMCSCCVYGHFISYKTTSQKGNKITLQDEIDPSTLSIHFPDMLASDSDRLLPNGEKDLRIFASLSEDGKGGDVLDLSGHVWDNQNIKANCIALYYDNKFGFRITNGKDFSSGYAPSFMYNWCGDFTITGIQQ